MQSISAAWLYPMPSLKGIAAMPWWAPLGGLVGAVAMIMGLLFVDKIGAGPFAGLRARSRLTESTYMAERALSLCLKRHLCRRADALICLQHSLNLWRILGGTLMTAGIVLIALF